MNTPEKRWWWDFYENGTKHTDPSPGVEDFSLFDRTVIAGLVSHEMCFPKEMYPNGPPKYQIEVFIWPNLKR